MKAMIFAAGKGTRLQPVTSSIPKALVKVKGRALLEIIIQKLISSGFDEIILNVHYKADQIIEFLKANDNFNVHIEISYEKDLLLDTGGGLKKAGYFFNDKKPFLVYNVDILSNLVLQDMYAFHLKSNALATLSVKERPSNRKLRFNENGQLCGWVDKKTGEEKAARNDQPVYEWAFNGIHIINPEIFKLIKEEGVFSIIDLYLRLAATENINYYYNPEADFIDVGTPEKLKRAEKFNF